MIKGKRIKIDLWVEFNVKLKKNESKMCCRPSLQQHVVTSDPQCVDSVSTAAVNSETDRRMKRGELACSFSNEQALELIMKLKGLSYRTCSSQRASSTQIRMRVRQHFPWLLFLCLRVRRRQL
ncbi:hypothetical protein INR49_024524 [Caranx melampygus]|nr:hypothetical protein INR49_024524 [Caranx melampygus]